MTQKLLRVWPGIVIVVLLWLSRFGIKAVIPGIDGFGKAMMTSFVFTVLLVIWWVFFSRARWLERLGALALIAAALTGTWFLRHDSMHLAWFLAYVIPVTSLAFVAWAVITRRLPDRVRHATMVATFLIAGGGWLLVRQASTAITRRRLAGAGRRVLKNECWPRPQTIRLQLPRLQLPLRQLLHLRRHQQLR
jgi:hypothetical protein